MNKKFRVVHFLPYFPPHSGGLEMYAKEWAENYVKDGGECLIVTFSGGQKELGRSENGYRIIILPSFDVVHSFPFPMIWLPSFWKGLREVKKWNADIIHTHTRFFLSSFLGGIFAQFYKIPWIHIEHGSGFVVSGNKIIEYISLWYDQTLGRWTLSHADEVVAVSKACENFVRNTFQIPKVSTIYRGMNPISTNIKPPKNEIHIGYVGRLVDLKGVDVLIEAFFLLQKRYIGNFPLKLKIIGDGPERQRLEALSRSYGLEKKIEFLGQKPIDEIRKELLPTFHIFVNPSFQEGFPTTVIEALLAGCSVLATDVGGTGEIRERILFSLIEPRNAEVIADEIIKIIHDLDIQKDPTRPPSLFPWEQSFGDFQKIYTRIINEWIFGKKSDLGK